MQIVCPSCQALNRLPADKNALQAQCGKCKQPLFQGHSLEVSAEVFQRHLEKNELTITGNRNPGKTEGSLVIKERISTNKPRAVKTVWATSS